ncbi:MAG: protein translocase subunit SecF, partial [Trueperella pyogenes]|nr:protein translocase subunit SecF [Trueperella pyogenes]
MMSYAQWGNALYSGEKSYRIVPKRRIFVRAALAVIAICAILIGIFGLNRSFEFTGGSQFTLTGLSETSQQPAYDAIQKGNLASEVRVSSVGVDGIRVQTESLDSQKTLEVREALASAYKVDAKDVQSASIGPSWGRDVTAKAAQSLVIFLTLVAVLMAAYFRSWTMSVAAIFALFHDIATTLGFFAVTRVEVSPATVIGFLTILGYSLYDTVVVFDKVRELTKG